MFSHKVYASLALAMMAKTASAALAPGTVAADCWFDEYCVTALDYGKGCLMPVKQADNTPYMFVTGHGWKLATSGYQDGYYMGTDFCGYRFQNLPGGTSREPTDAEKSQAYADAYEFCYQIGAKSACIWGDCANTCKKKIVGNGDPHFQGWNGEYYDFHGVCDLKFIESKAHNLTINIRTSQRYQYSYISSAAVELNGDVFELGSYGDAVVNGVSIQGDNSLPKTLGGYGMAKLIEDDKTHSYAIYLDETGTSIQLKTFKDMVGVTLYGTAKQWADSVGLMGSSITGLKLARDGETVMEDMNAFGQEWQVQADEKMLFQAAREPQAPAKCVIPDPASAESRRLGQTIAREAAEEACKNWGMNKAACISDVMATGDLETAKNFY